MKTELTIRKVKCTQEFIGKDILIPATENGEEIIKPLPYAELMACQINYKAKHNLERHDLFHACVKLVSDNTGDSETVIKERCKIDCRWIESYVSYIDKNGNKRINIITKSISFSKMSLQDANEFYSKAFDILASYLKISTEEMINEAKLRMKGKHFCLLCGMLATQKHHRFSQSKWAIEKYGRKLIDNEKNIEWICMNCHSSHNKIPPELNWSEKQFREAMGLEKASNDTNNTKDNIINLFDGKEVK